MAGLIGFPHSTPLFLFSEELRETNGINGVGVDASGGLLLLFAHGVLDALDVKEAARKAILTWLATPRGQEALEIRDGEEWRSPATEPARSPYSWNDAAHEMPAEAWQAQGLNLVGVWSIEETAPLNEPVRKGE